MAERDAHPSTSTFSEATGTYQNVGSQYIYNGPHNSDGNKKTPKNFQFGLPPLVEITGRDEDVKKLTKLIKTEQRIVISGMGGVGKTSLSAHCARKWLKGVVFRRWFRKFNHVIFIDTETNETIDNSIRGLCDQLNIRMENYYNQRKADYMQLIYKKFKRGKLLVIFDNVISFLSVQDYLPPQDLHNINTILTSQNIEFRFPVHKLEVLNEKTCLELIKNQFGEQWAEMGDQQEEINKLMEKLQFLPLAICQAVANIKDQLNFGDKTYTITKYLTNFEKTFQYNIPEYTNDIYKKTAFTAIKINMSHLDLDSKYEKIAKRALYCMGYLDPSSISEELLLPLFGIKGDDIIQVKRLLQKYSLIDSDNRENINIHRLVQESCRILTKGDSAFNKYFKNVLKEVLSTDTYRSHINFLIPYIENFGLDILKEIYKEMYSYGDRKQRLKEALESMECEGWTVLHYAVFENNWGVLDLLIGSEQNNCTISATLNIDYNMRRVLRLERGNVIVQTRDKITALNFLLSGKHDIDKCRRCHLVLNIIKSGYNNNIINKDGDTVAHLSFINNHLYVLRYLLHYCKIDIFLTNNQGEDINNLFKKKHIILYKITSPNHDRSWYEPVQVKPLTSSEQGVALLKKQLNQRAPDSVWEKIVELFDNVPEALRLAAAYIQHEQLSVNDFQKHFISLCEDRVYQSFTKNCYGYECQNFNILLCTILEYLKFNKQLCYIILVNVSCKDNWLYAYRLHNLSNKVSRENINTNIKELKKWFLLEQNEFGECKVSYIVRYASVMFSHKIGDMEDVCTDLITHNRGSHIAVRYLGEGGVQKAYADMYNSKRAARPKWLNKLCSLKLVTDEDIGKFTALHWAAGCDDNFVISELIEMGLYVNTATFRGVTPLHITVTSDYMPYNLLNAGGDVNARDITGNTPAHWAAITRFSKYLMDLQLHGADLSIRNNYGLTPYDILKRRNKKILY